MELTVEPPAREPGRGTLRRGSVWLLSAALLLAVGFLAYVFVVAQVVIGRTDPAVAPKTQAAFLLYAQLVLLKGLLPQLLLAMSIWGLLDHFLALGRRGRQALILGVVAAAAVAAAVVIPTLLTREGLTLPGVKFRDAWNVGQTFLEMTLGVSAAMLVSRWIALRG